MQDSAAETDFAQTRPRRFVGRKASKKQGIGSRGRMANSIPLDILENKDLQAAISLLPNNYNLEIPKTVWQVRKNNAKRVALQVPEGLALFACTISDILEEFCGCETVIMGDVTFGACCIDDYTALALECDMIVHYGHSCLIPVDETPIKTLYIFVNIQINIDHLCKSIVSNFDAPPQCLLESNFDAKDVVIQNTVNLQKELHFALVGTVQFVASLATIRDQLTAMGYKVIIPQIKPLSPGEILGCTSPNLFNTTITHILYVGDGRFHLESIMIQNPHLQAIKYDPYAQTLTREHFDHSQMHQLRSRAIAEAKFKKNWAIILGTLGRQGSLSVVNNLSEKIKSHGYNLVTILLSEIHPSKLSLFNDVDVFVQVACPRLSVDWGYAFEKPLLSPYECAIILNCLETPKWTQNSELSAYTMDYYANNSLGSWTPNHFDNLRKKI